jgi:hypothetical protein
VVAFVDGGSQVNDFYIRAVSTARASAAPSKTVVASLTFDSQNGQYAKNCMRYLCTEAGSGWMKSSLPRFAGGNTRFFGGAGAFFFAGFLGLAIT